MTAPALAAIVAAFDRPARTVETLRRIMACDPAPAEILVHVDAGGEFCAAALRAAFPDLRLLGADRRVGPGGARNRLLAEVRAEWAASFDDDSYPEQIDFFARAARAVAVAAADDVAVIACGLRHPGESAAPPAPPRDAASFGAGAALLRRSAFLEAGGFVPLAVAYGMEEEDLTLRLLDRGWRLRRDESLRVYHDADRARHADPAVTAGVVANLALLAFLRYPARAWGYGALQVANRAWWSLKVGRRAGLARGLASIPGHLWRHRALRACVRAETLRARAALRAAERAAPPVKDAP